MYTYLVLELCDTEIGVALSATLAKIALADVRFEDWMAVSIPVVVDCVATGIGGLWFLIKSVVLLE